MEEKVVAVVEEEVAAAVVEEEVEEETRVLSFILPGEYDLNFKSTCKKS